MNIKVLGDRKKRFYDESLIDKVNAMYAKKVVSDEGGVSDDKKDIFAPSGFEVFEGKSYAKLMPEIADKELILGMNGIMRRRVFGSDDDITYFRKRSFDTVDSCACHSDGRFKIVYDCELLKDVNPKSVLVNGALLLGNGVYDNLSGVVFSASDRRYTNRALTEVEAKKDPFWLAFARNDQELLDQYVEEVFKFLKDVKNEDKGMNVVLPNVVNYSSLRAWCLSLFNNSYNRYGSSARGDCNLDCLASLVRVVAPEVQK